MLLRDKDEQELMRVFAGIKTPIEIWAYGSRVRGKAHNGSDLDLVLRTYNLKPLSGNEFSNICEKITESNVTIFVELRDWATLPVSFHKNILQNYEVLFSSLPTALNEPEVFYDKDIK